MILIVGGAFQGKLEFARKLTGYPEEDFADGRFCEWETVFSARGICYFHEFVKRCLENGRDCADLAERMEQENPDVVIISQELGYGIVPYEPFDRKWRETTGRVCTQLAKRSSRVYRVVCGVGMALKNDGGN